LSLKKRSRKSLLLEKRLRKSFLLGKEFVKELVAKERLVAETARCWRKTWMLETGSGMGLSLGNLLLLG
jgi:hypothetical protein